MTATTDAQAPDAAPEDAPTEETAGSESQVSQVAETPLEEVTDWAELNRRLNALDNPPPAKAPEPEAAEEDPEAQAEETAPEARDDEEDDEEEKPLPKNFRFHTEDPQRAKFLRLMRQNPEANPVELAKIAGYEVTAKEAKAEAVQAEQAQEAPDPLQALREEIKDLQAKKKGHREAYEFEKADELNDKILDKRLELELAQLSLKEQATQKAQFDADYAQARQEAAQRHPEIVNKGSKQFRLSRMLVAQKESEDPSFFNDPNYPLAIIAELERDFPEAFPKKGQAKAAPAAPLKGAPQAKPAQPARPIGQTVTGAAGGPRLSNPADLAAAIAALTPEEAVKLGHLVGTK